MPRFVECYGSPGGYHYTGYDFVDLNGKPIERDPWEYPYSYDTYVLWRGDYNKKKAHFVYSDRMFSWDSKKFNECLEKVFSNKGQDFSSRPPKKIEKFLSLYFDKEIKLTAILQGCNHSSGFPLWVFVYENVEENNDNN